MSRRLLLVVILCFALLTALTAVLTIRGNEPKGSAKGCGSEQTTPATPGDAFPEDSFMEAEDATGHATPTNPMDTTE